MAMDEKTLAEIEARANAALPGAWHAQLVDNGAWQLMATLPGPGSRIGVLGQRFGWEEFAKESQATGTFIAHAREDVPALVAEVKRLREQKDSAYSERNQCIAVMARMARLLGWRVGLALHPESDATWEKDWRTILFIDTPDGQVSWHFHDSEADLLRGLPAYRGTYDGHTTPEKYARLREVLK